MRPVKNDTTSAQWVGGVGTKNIGFCPQFGTNFWGRHGFRDWLASTNKNRDKHHLPRSLISKLLQKADKHHQITGWKSSSQISSKLQRWVSMEAIEIMRMLTTAKAPATRRHPSWYRIPTSALCTDMDNTPAPIAALLKQRPVGRTPPRRKMEELFSTILLDMSESPTSLSPPHVVLAVSRSTVLFFTSMRSMESQAKLESWDASNWVGAVIICAAVQLWLSFFCQAFLNCRPRVGCVPQIIGCSRNNGWSHDWQKHSLRNHSCLHIARAKLVIFGMVIPLLLGILIMDTAYTPLLLGPDEHLLTQGILGVRCLDPSTYSLDFCIPTKNKPVETQLYPSPHLFRTRDDCNIRRPGEVCKAKIC